MTKISGRDVLSEATEKSQQRLLLVAVLAIVSKAYHLPVNEIKMLGMEIPSAIFDVSMLLLVLWGSYSYIVKWTGDLMSFRLWYTESSIWSQFGTHMKLDKTFINGGIEALKVFHDIHQAGLSPSEYDNLPEKEKKLYVDFKTNAELYAVKLDYAGKKFTAISAFGHFYIWIQGFAIPVILALVAVYLLIKYGSFSGPQQF